MWRLYIILYSYRIFKCRNKKVGKQIPFYGVTLPTNVLYFYKYGEWHTKKITMQIKTTYHLPNVTNLFSTFKWWVVLKCLTELWKLGEVIGCLIPFSIGHDDVAVDCWFRDMKMAGSILDLQNNRRAFATGVVRLENGIG